MKKFFERLRLEIYDYDLEDVLTASSDGGGGGGSSGGGGGGGSGPQDPYEGPLTPA